MPGADHDDIAAPIAVKRRGRDGRGAVHPAGFAALVADIHGPLLPGVLLQSPRTPERSRADPRRCPVEDRHLGPRSRCGRQLGDMAGTPITLKCCIRPEPLLWRCWGAAATTGRPTGRLRSGGDKRRSPGSPGKTGSPEPNDAVISDGKPAVKRRNSRTSRGDHPGLPDARGPDG